MTGCAGDIDLMVAIDGSGSIGHTNFQKVKQFVMSLLQDMDEDNSITSGSVNVGAIAFSSE